jgi:ABC-type polysaccharide/polyol phosphate transport system ATPase subunit
MMSILPYDPSAGTCDESETGLDRSGLASSRMAIDLSNVTVAYRSYKERPSSAKESMIRFLRDGKLSHYSTFNALSDVSLQIPRGKVYGFVGSNGSGKSTLLKVLAGVLMPTRGRVVVNGSIASLIELGAGFDPELNAIENIYLNGSLHRKSRLEIKERVEQILDFAELNDFATTPIKYYSSGMYARLGFSVAVDINPDVLLVDEILGVGDERFQEKCSKVFERFLASGKTLVLVSHNLGMLEKTADKVGLISRGRLVYLGSPHLAIQMYRHRCYQTAL